MLAYAIRQLAFENNIARLVALPEWKFCIVFAEGFYSDPCAGCEFEGVVYSEAEIYFAYMQRNPGAEPLI